MFWLLEGGVYIWRVGGEDVVRGRVGVIREVYVFFGCKWELGWLENW